MFLKIWPNTWSLAFLRWCDNADLQLDSFLICATFFCPPEWQLYLFFYGHSVHPHLSFDCVTSKLREINGSCSEEQKMKMVVTSFMAWLEPAHKGSYWKYGSFGTFLSCNTLPAHLGSAFQNILGTDPSFHPILRWFLDFPGGHHSLWPGLVPVTKFPYQTDR